MAILKAYFDDSTAFDDKGRPVLLTIGGYLSDVDSWGRFDTDWKQILDDSKVEYLHMKEFWDNDGAFKHIKNDPEKERAFFHRLVQAIRKHTKFCTQTTILLDELTRFNADHNLELEPLALGVYGCLLALQFQFPRGEMEVIFDRFERADRAIKLGREYLQSDISAQAQPGDKPDPFLSVSSFEKKDSWRNIQPMQAADWLSWEMRKTCVDTKPWIKQKGHEPRIDWIRNFDEWAKGFAEEKGRPFRNRKSFIALREANPPQGFIWNYEQLGILLKRHLYGWALRRKKGRIQILG